VHFSEQKGENVNVPKTYTYVVLLLAVLLKHFSIFEKLVLCRKTLYRDSKMKIYTNDTATSHIMTNFWSLAMPDLQLINVWDTLYTLAIVSLLLAATIPHFMHEVTRDHTTKQTTGSNNDVISRAQAVYLQGVHAVVKVRGNAGERRSWAPKNCWWAFPGPHSR